MAVVEHAFYCFANTGSEADGTIAGWASAILPRLKDRDNDPLSPGREGMLLPNPVKQGQEKFIRRREEARQHPWECHER
jgi:hypothetical protein